MALCTLPMQQASFVKFSFVHGAAGARLSVDRAGWWIRFFVGHTENMDQAPGQINVLGTPLMPCSYDPMTGYYRTGCCENRGDDPGMHTVCSRVTAAFLEFSASQGNDLSTPMPQYGFAGLNPGDQWCVCAMRWKDAFDAGMACDVVLESTHVSTLEYVDLAHLQAHAIIAD